MQRPTVKQNAIPTLGDYKIKYCTNTFVSYKGSCFRWRDSAHNVCNNFSRYTIWDTLRHDNANAKLVSATSFQFFSPSFFLGMSHSSLKEACIKGTCKFLQ